MKKLWFIAIRNIAVFLICEGVFRIGYWVAYRDDALAQTLPSLTDTILAVVLLYAFLKEVFYP